MIDRHILISNSEKIDSEIEMEELEKALRKAGNGKAAGDDECINEILKLGGETMKISLLPLFRKVWRRESTSRLG